jgi:hypothetical protein
MSQQTSDVGSIPEWDLADRMRKTLRASGTSVQEVADYFEVSRNTVGPALDERRLGVLSREVGSMIPSGRCWRGSLLF